MGRQMTYQPQLNDLRYTLKDIAGFDKLVSDGLFPELDQDLVDAVLEEAGKFKAQRGAIWEYIFSKLGKH